MYRYKSVNLSLSVCHYKENKIIRKKLDVLSAKAERGLPPVREIEREREREIH